MSVRISTRSPTSSSSMSAGAPDDALRVQEFVQAPLTALDSQTTLLVAAERGVRARAGAAAVDVDHPRAELFRDTVGTHRIGGPDAAPQAEVVGVGKTDRFFFV